MLIVNNLTRLYTYWSAAFIRCLVTTSKHRSHIARVGEKKGLPSNLSFCQLQIKRTNSSYVGGKRIEIVT